MFHKSHESFSSTTYRRYGKYSQTVVDSVFGGWKNAMGEIGLPIKTNIFGKERMKSDIQSVYKKYGFISAKTIESECDFTYTAASIAFNGADGIEKECEVKFSGKRSGAEEMLFVILKSIYGKEAIEREKTFSWLLNPLTGRKLHTDFYVLPIETCVEFDGKHHFSYIKLFFKTKEDFEAAKQRDKTKSALISEHNMRLVRFRYDEPISEEYVREKLTV